MGEQPAAEGSISNETDVFDPAVPTDPFRPMPMPHTTVHTRLTEALASPMPLPGTNTALEQYGPTYGTFLTEAVGSLFDPPLNFVPIQIPDNNTFDMISDEYDFAFCSPATASCQFLAANGLVFPILTLSTGERRMPSSFHPFIPPPPLPPLPKAATQFPAAPSWST